jgi:3-hydroxybutyryl-CoA dehydrogenase
MQSTAIGVVGAGVMGAGVAQTLAQSGHSVILVDVDEDALEGARRAVRSNVRMQALLGKKQGVVPPPAAVEQRIRFSTRLADVASASYVIENATERWPVKREIYPELDRLCAPEVIFAANTSAFPITRIGSLTERPDRVIGIHFMNPVPLKPMVELIPGFHTSKDTLERTEELLRRMGKQAVRVNDAPGFVSNRVLMLTINEAAFLVQDGVASAEDVDRIFCGCFDHAMGPLATADMIGLDTILFSIEVLQDAFADSKYRPCPLLKKMVDAGLLGRKSGRGFFDYSVAQHRAVAR